MKKFIGTLLTAAVLAAGVTTVAFSEEKEGRIQQRKENQQKRIAQGVSSGSLTAHETAKIERKETALNQEIRQDRKANGGKLTNQEKAQVNRQQNRLSKDIYRQKHDAQTQGK